MNPHTTFRNDASLHGNEHSILCKSHRHECQVAELSKESSVSLRFSWRRCVLLLLLSCSVVSDSLHPTDCNAPGFPVLHYIMEFVQNSCPLSQRCHPTISSSVIPFSSCPQSFPSSESFPMSWLLASGGQSIGASPSASVLQ